MFEPPVQRLIDELSRLPGIGRKSAQRLAFHLLNTEKADAENLGNAIIELGGGRRKVGEKLDLSVGFSDIAAIGTELDANTPLAVVHAASEDDADAAEANLLAAITLAPEPPAGRPVVCEILTA